MFRYDRSGGGFRRGSQDGFGRRGSYDDDGGGARFRGTFLCAWQRFLSALGEPGFILFWFVWTLANGFLYSGPFSGAGGCMMGAPIMTVLLVV